MLETRDVRGRNCSSTQYLESTLTDIMNVRNFNDKSKKIRESIINFFKYRDCVTLVRPCNEESD